MTNNSINIERLIQETEKIDYNKFAMRCLRGEGHSDYKSNYLKVIGEIKTILEHDSNPQVKKDLKEALRLQDINSHIVTEEQFERGKKLLLQALYASKDKTPEEQNIKEFPVPPPPYASLPVNDNEIAVIFTQENPISSNIECLLKRLDRKYTRLLLSAPIINESARLVEQLKAFSSAILILTEDPNTAQINQFDVGLKLGICISKFGMKNVLVLFNEDTNVDGLPQIPHLKLGQNIDFKKTLELIDEIKKL